MKIKYIIMIAFTFLSACSHPQRSSKLEAINLNFEQVKDLPLVENSTSIEQQLGRPSNTSENDNTIKWFYAKGDYYKVVIQIDKTTGKIFSKFWMVEDGEKERDLNYLLAQVPNGHFEKYDSKFIPPHKSKPSEFWLEDRNLGVFIEVNKMTKVVEAVYWCAANISLSAKNCLKHQKDRSIK